jgi:hypothetical protein
MKTVFTTLALLCTSFLASAQISLSASSGVTFAMYSNLKEAFDSINAGYHQGAIAIDITASHALTATAKLDSSGRPNIATSIPSNYTSVLIKPIFGAGVVTISGSIATAPLIDLNGADHVTIDGLNNGFDSLVLSNTSTGATNTCTIRFVNDASFNTITNTKVVTSSTATIAAVGGAIVFSTAVAGGAGNDSNTVSNCTLTTASTSVLKLLHFLGSTTNSGIQNSGNRITTNYFENAKASGIYAAAGNRDLTISNNHFYQTIPGLFATTASASYSPIFVSNATAGLGQNFSISGNFIGGSAPFCGGAKPTVTMSTSASYYFQPIYLNADTSVRSYITNNNINNIYMYSSAAHGNGSFICVNSGSVDVTGNQIGSQTDTSSLVVNMYLTSLQNFVTFGLLGASPTNNFGLMRYENNWVGGVTISNLLSTSGASSTASAVFSFFNIVGTNGQFMIRNNVFGSPNTANSVKSNANNGAFNLFRGASSTNLLNEFVGNTISNITHYNITTTNGLFQGFTVGGTGAWRVDSNTFEKITVNTNNTNGLSNGNKHLLILSFNLSGSTPGTSCIGNTIRNCVSTSNGAVYSQNIAIDVLSTPLGGITIAQNRISRFYTKSSLNTSVVYGLRLNTTATPINVYNNEISLGEDSLLTPSSNALTIFGMYRSGTGVANIYHNAVLINGNNVNADTNTYAFYNATGGTTDVRNNVFVNNRSFNTITTTGNFAAAYAGSISAGSIAGLTNDYNLYYAGGVGGKVIQNSATPSTDYIDLFSWRAAAYAHDFNSVSASPIFVSDTILGGVTGSGITTGDPTLTSVLYDITGSTRPNPSLMGPYSGYNPTPVKLSYLRGVGVKDDAILTWATASEINNKGFEVQRSVDGKHFETIGFIKGNGSSSKVMNYKFVDENAFAKGQQPIANSQFFYRLNQIDFDGKHECSQIVLVTKSQIKETAKVEVFPNPFNNDLFVDITNAASSATVAIFNLQGKEVYNNAYSLQGGTTTLAIDGLVSLPIGMYSMHITSGGVTRMLKIVKN